MAVSRVWSLNKVLFTLKGWNLSTVKSIFQKIILGIVFEIFLKAFLRSYMALSWIKAHTLSESVVLPSILGLVTTWVMVSFNPVTFERVMSMWIRRIPLGLDFRLDRGSAMIAATNTLYFYSNQFYCTECELYRNYHRRLLQHFLYWQLMLLRVGKEWPEEE